MVWNQSTGNAPRVGSQKVGPRVWFGVLLGCCVILLGAGVAWLVLGPDAGAASSGDANGSKAPKNTQSTSSVPASVPAVDIPTSGGSEADAVGAVAPEGARPVAEEAVSATAGTPVKTNAEAVARMEKFKHEPVKGRAEQLLMLVIPPKKGEIVPPVPIALEEEPELEQEAQELLERQGVVEDWDTDDSIGIKERLELLKEAWYEYKKQGGTFHEFILAQQRESQTDTMKLEEARKFDEENYRDQTLSNEEYDQLHEKVNKLMEVQGFDKIERPDEEPKLEEEEQK